MAQTPDAPLDALWRQLEETPTDVASLVDWIGLASRAAVLGKLEYLNRASEHFSHLALSNEDVCGIILARFKEGAWDLARARDEFQGLAVIDAQDWHLLSLVDPPPDWLSKDIREFIHAWVCSTRDVLYEEDSAEVVEAYRDAYPIPEEKLIAAVARPMYRSEALLLRKLADHLRAQERASATEEEERSMPALAAKAPARPETVRWMSPEGGLVAEADMIFDQGRVVLAIKHTDGMPAIPLAGLGGTLAAVPFQLTERATCEIMPAGDRAYPLRVKLNRQLRVTGLEWSLMEINE